MVSSGILQDTIDTRVCLINLRLSVGICTIKRLHVSRQVSHALEYLLRQDILLFLRRKYSVQY